jgi:hypothetical protein
MVKFDLKKKDNMLFATIRGFGYPHMTNCKENFVSIDFPAIIW